MKPIQDGGGNLYCSCEGGKLEVREFGERDGYQSRWVLLYCASCNSYFVLTEVPEPGESVRRELERTKEILGKLAL